MLPSTGYFKGINCPFYDSGLCERPYCHFRHVKKEPQNVNNDGIESGDILQKLVSAAVQKVLQQTDSSSSPTQNVTEPEINNLHHPTSKATYNPTPIAELNKINNLNDDNEEKTEQKRRHIPVPYTPRKPATLPIKRPAETNGTQLFTYIPPAKYNPGSENVHLDPYTPKGAIESKEKYLPGSETEIPKYTINETPNSQVNYIPSDRHTNKKNILEYKPIKVKNQQTTVKYQPTPKALVPCFSSDEDEPETKKAKLSNDLNGLDDLGAEFDILEQILDDETKNKSVSDISATDLKNENTDVSKENKVEKSEKNKGCEQKIYDKSRDKVKHKSRSKEKSNKTRDNSKHRSKDKSKDRLKDKSKDRSREKSKDKTSDKSKHKRNDKSNERNGSQEKKSNSDNKTSYKSSNKDKSRSKSKDRSVKKPNKSSTKSSKHSKSSSSNHNKSKTSNKNHEENHHKSHSHFKESNKKRRKDDDNTHKLDSDSEDHNYEELIEDELNDLSESDEERIAEECKRIYEEYVPSEKICNKPEKSETEPDQEDCMVPTKKRISRTIDKNIKIISKAPLKPDFKANAAQAMAERLVKVREFHAAKNSSKNIIAGNTLLKPELVKPNVISKVRIAHVPYASTLLSAKKVISPMSKSIKPEPCTSTSTQTVKKGTQRVAHIPNEKFIDRPGVLEPLGSKIPANIRSTYLNLMIDHCLKIYLLATDAYARAQNEELATSKKCSTVQIYKNSSVLTISRLKKELQECNGVKKSGDNCSSLQKTGSQVGVSKSSNTGSWSIENKNRNNTIDTKQFFGSKLYNNIIKWVLPEEQLQANGFPRPHSSGEKGRAIIYGQNKQNPPKGYIRTCCRCKKNYTVDKKGFAAVKEECIYHPNNKYRVRGEARYQCCGQDSTSDGCCMATTHVYEYVDFENLKGYVKTLPPDTEMEDYGIYSLDCEMCYTTHGLDLTRVTVINSSCKVIYETLIKPLHPIIDYNTRYSGITEEQMYEVKTTLLEVQATLLSMFSSKTILIGHSLESDFKALKLIHDTVIDTSVLFPHKMGPPYKRALRNLSSEYLKKIIQNSVDGHDSAEDATVCMELILYKVKEDLKSR